ncbi:MAG TPA: VCBS repeat-containing protein, partial [Parafilimonas sp.]|nr:VCBS repeat-containing protein [Parafilimonas sp.]
MSNFYKKLVPFLSAAVAFVPFVSAQTFTTKTDKPFDVSQFDNVQATNSPLFNNSWYGFATGIYGSGQSPSQVKSADLDNDGDSDIIVSQENFSNGFVVLKNQGNFLFSAPVKYKSTKASKDIVVADLNNDGKKDVALTNSGFYFDGNTISVYFNQGSGNFGNATNYTVSTDPIGIAAADFDNDGDADLAVANNRASGGTISILVNKGDGTFKTAVNFPAGQTPYKITVAKINNDNLIDIVVANEGEKMNILFNGGSNNFSNRVETVVQSEAWGGDLNANVEAADIDNDGDNDILYSSSLTWDGNNTGQIALFRNTGNGTFSPTQLINLGIFSGGAVDMDVADLNGDGWKDIVGANFSGRIGDGYQVVLNNGSGNFLPAVVKPAGQSTYTLTTADVNNDHKIDVITCDWYSLQVTVHKNNGNANFPIPPMFNSNNATAGALDAADIDGDGDLDVVSSASSIAAVNVKVTVQKNNGNGTFTDGVSYSIRGGGVRAKFRDLNGDGKPDLLFATAIGSPPYDFHTAINNGDGTFGARQTWSMNACGWNDIETADLDNDGDLDVVVTEWLGCQNISNSARRIFISKNNGHGVFSAPLIKIVNPFPGSIATGDFNEDGKIDLVTGQSPGIDLHRGTGTGDLLPPVSFATQKAPYTIIATDLNNDGHLDIAACTEYNSEGMSVLLGSGNGTFQPAQNYDGAYSPDLRNESGIATGDVDADGDIDIIVGNAASNDVSIYLNKGDGHFIFRERAGMYWGVASPVYADFTGDGKNDIIAIVGTPPSGIASQLALIKGTVQSTSAIANNRTENNPVLNTQSGSEMMVMNNPFSNYIDIKFDKIQTGKITLQLSDL